MAMDEPPIVESGLLLVEGKDDKNFFEAMLKHMNITRIRVYPIDGKAAFRDRLGSLLKSSDVSDSLRAVGVIRDADESSRRAFQSVGDALRFYDFPTPMENGEFAHREGRSVGVLILGDSEGQGMLESVLLRTIDDPHQECIHQFIDCVRRKQSRRRFAKSPKAIVHAYIATTRFPQVSVGVAAQKNIWNLDHLELGQIRTFLRQLSESSGES